MAKPEVEGRDQDLPKEDPAPKQDPTQGQDPKEQKQGEDLPTQWQNTWVWQWDPADLERPEIRQVILEHYVDLDPALSEKAAKRFWRSLQEFLELHQESLAEDLKTLYQGMDHISLFRKAREEKIAELEAEIAKLREEIRQANTLSTDHVLADVIAKLAGLVPGITPKAKVETVNPESRGPTVTGRGRLTLDRLRQPDWDRQNPRDLPVVIDGERYYVAGIYELGRITRLARLLDLPDHLVGRDSQGQAEDLVRELGIPDEDPPYEFTYKGHTVRVEKRVKRPA